MVAFLFQHFKSLMTAAELLLSFTLINLINPLLTAVSRGFPDIHQIKKKIHNLQGKNNNTPLG